MTDEQGQPLSSVSVWPRRAVSIRGRDVQAYPIPPAHSNWLGRFTLHLPPGTGYELRVQAWGHVDARIPNLAAEGEKDIGAVALKKADAFVAGKVTDADGKPARGARVRAWTEAQPWLANTFITTNAEGRYKVEGLAPGKMNLTVQHTSGQSTKENVETGSENVDILLTPRREDAR